MPLRIIASAAAACLGLPPFFGAIPRFHQWHLVFAITLSTVCPPNWTAPFCGAFVGSVCPKGAKHISPGQRLGR
jgi:hypothetical protein